MNTLQPNTKNVKFGKKRNWATVFYPDSVPDDWVSKLAKTGLPCAISPLHDRDVWTESDEVENPEHKAGELKKPHWHILLFYSGPTTFQNVQNLVATFKGLMPEPINSPRGCYEYLTHKNNPEKAQYDEKEIQCLNGFFIGDYYELTKSQELNNKKELIKIIEDNNIKEYRRLLMYVCANCSEELQLTVTSKTIFFNAYLCSKRNEEKQKNENSTPKTAADAMRLAADALGDEPSDALY